MKKKLVSVLLALTLCGSLTILVFAEPMEEPPMPEASEVLTGEEAHEHEEEQSAPGKSEVLTGEEEGTVVEAICGHIHWLEDCGEEDNWGPNQFDKTVYSYKEDSDKHTDSSILSDHVHYNEYVNILYEGYKKDRDQHRYYVTYETRCIICGADGTQNEYEDWEPHSWKKGSLNGYQSSNAVGHVAVYNYRCICGETKTEAESSLEPHSMRRVGYTGNNHHQGTKHYFEYQYQCTQCGYTKTQYESYSCPGPQGGGCIMPDTPINRVEPPVEVQDVTELEEREVLTGEEVTDLSGLTEEEEKEEAYCFGENILEVYNYNVHFHVEEHYDYEEPYETEDGATVLGVEYGYMCFDDSCPYIEALRMAREDTNVHPNVENDWETPILRSHEAGFCSECGKSDWGPGTDSRPNCVDDTISADTHNEYFTTYYKCRTFNCPGGKILYKSRETPHSWVKGSLAGTWSGSGNTHIAEYNYTCKCGSTKTGTESHSLSKYDVGGNYHKGALHYLEWIWRCSDCGYTESRWESFSCPGNNNGVGCVIPINKVEPPVEVQDVAEPEETT